MHEIDFSSDIIIPPGVLRTTTRNNTINPGLSPEKAAEKARASNDAGNLMTFFTTEQENVQFGIENQNHEVLFIISKTLPHPVTGEMHEYRCSLVAPSGSYAEGGVMIVADDMTYLQNCMRTGAEPTARFIQEFPAEVQEIYYSSEIASVMTYLANVSNKMKSHVANTENAAVMRTSKAVRLPRSIVSAHSQTNLWLESFIDDSSDSEERLDEAMGYISNRAGKSFSSRQVERRLLRPEAMSRFAHNIGSMMQMELDHKALLTGKDHIVVPHISVRSRPPWGYTMEFPFTLQNALQHMKEFQEIMEAHQKSYTAGSLWTTAMLNERNSNKLKPQPSSRNYIWFDQHNNLRVTIGPIISHAGVTEFSGLLTDRDASFPSRFPPGVVDNLRRNIALGTAGRLRQYQPQLLVA